jgi:hypothetical protein
MRLALVHGMRQEGRDSAELRKSWLDALQAAWVAAGLAIVPCEVEMPFYGDELDRLTREARQGNRAAARGDNFAPVSEEEEELLLEYGRAFNVTNEEAGEALGPETAERGMGNWQSAQGIARALQRRVPLFGSVGLNFVHQVEAYLTRPHIRHAVDAIVRPALLEGPTVVVAHSLGTVVSYCLLAEAGSEADIPLFVTLGCPLGIGVVRERVQPPRPPARPQGVRRWINATDKRDYVALYHRLDPTTFADGIENFDDVSNRRQDPHFVGDYLSHRRIAKSIFAGLTGY